MFQLLFSIDKALLFGIQKHILYWQSYIGIWNSYKKNSGNWYNMV